MAQTGSDVATMKPAIICKSTGKITSGMDMILNNNTWYNESEVRKYIAIISLSGGIKEYGTPDLNEAQRLLDKGVKVTNLAKFVLKNSTLYFNDRLTLADGDRVTLLTDFTDRKNHCL